ncbi:hypothetical protein GTP46_22920 [Duganella sp. FT135W]|uniref:TniQ family protein n=1 Tax=Duganella flavida TaxID=2692175 RepID=A0A6L8KFM3_9BURK|nr:TniQ family protein [Duganella flavida]MYM25487.1 hypothetical protein [Duganella flavida]
MTTIASAPIAPIRPAKKPGEWIESYLVRVARANGLRYPSASHIERLKSIALELGPKVESDAQSYLSPLPIWAKKKTGSPIRYCPACFQEERCVQTRWRLTRLEMCTKHHLHLKTGLVEPALCVTVNYPNPIQLNEITDSQLWDGATCPMPAEKNYALGMWEAFERASIEGDSEHVAEHLAWVLLAEYILDAVISTGEGPEIPVRGHSRLSQRAQWLRDAGLTISPSYGAIVAFLTSLKNLSERRAAARCLRTLMKDTEQSSPLLRSLPLQELLDRLHATSPEMYCPSAQGALPIQYHPEGYVSLNYAELLLGRDTNFVHFLVRANFFERVKKVRFGKRVFFFVHQAEIESCRRWLSDCMTPVQLMKHWNINRTIWRALHRNGICRPFKIGIWAYHRIDEINTLTIKLESTARLMIGQPTQRLPLFDDWLLGPSTPPSVFKTILDEILEGRIKLYRVPEHPGLSGYYVDAAAEVRAKEISRCTRRCHHQQSQQLALFDSDPTL